MMNKTTAFVAIAGFLVGVTACSAARPLSSPTPNPAASPTAAPVATATGGMTGMDHGSTMMNAPFDAMFIDGMIKHHEGAIAMAKEAQQKATRPEIKQLAAAILKTQQAEIDLMNTWRTQWYPDLKSTDGMGMDMGLMTVSEGTEPYEIRFLVAMIPHHESAVMMSQQANQRAEHPELKRLAGDIIQAQTAEIEQMKKWYQDWAGKPYPGA